MLPEAQQMCQLAFPNPSPLQGEAQHTVCCIWFPKAMGNMRRSGRRPCLITVIILLVKYLPDFTDIHYPGPRSWQSHFRLISPELSRSKRGSWGVTFKTQSFSWQQKQQVLSHIIIWNKTAPLFEQLYGKSVNWLDFINHDDNTSTYFLFPVFCAIKWPRDVFPFIR